ncbi:hypothetical protein PVAND_015241 [Polypedilum vanderplanki]|uniref:Uncharacterized protein n=1 Tax=Polypedilum vanderplanki TaxID=319348 RepID=A0A9J6BCH6_POLVA|nr:hypothetical protein PVAND_015241 [Polypedilum vanderplanki]
MSLCEIFSALKIETLEKLERCYQYLKFKVQKLRGGTTRVTPMFIQFSDFFWCNKFLSKLGYSVLSEVETSEKMQRKLCYVSLTFFVLLSFFIQVSFVRSTHNLMTGDNLFIAMENAAGIGFYSLLLLKWYFLLHRNREIVIKIVMKLDEHYPHSGIDQMNFNTKHYLG